MSLLQAVINALIQLETSGSASIGPETNTNTVVIFGQKIEVSETATISLKKL